MLCVCVRTCVAHEYLYSDGMSVCTPHLHDWTFTRRHLHMHTLGAWDHDANYFDGLRGSDGLWSPDRGGLIMV